MTNLPTDIEPGDSGHISHSDTVHALLNPVDAPFEVAPILVESFYADRPAAGQAGRLFGAVDTGAFEFDDGAVWRSPFAVAFVDDIAERDALTPTNDTVVIIRNINRMHRWNGTRWVAPDETKGIYVKDYGGLGNGTDCLAAANAAAIVAASTGCRTVIFDTPSTFWYWATPIDAALYGDQFHWVGEGGGGSSQFNFTQVPIACGSGAAFRPTNGPGGIGSGNRSTIENFDLVAGESLFHNDPSDSTASPYGDALWRIINCGASVTATGGADNAPIIVEKGFWVWIEKCGLIGARVATTTTNSETLSGSPFTIEVASTAGMPSSGTVVIGAPYTSATRFVYYSGKTSNSLTGCTSPYTNTFGAGSSVIWWGPPLILRGGSPTYGSVGPNYLIRVKECRFSGAAAQIDQLGPFGGPFVEDIIFDDVQGENTYRGLVCINNASGAPLPINNLVFRSSSIYDPISPSAVLEGNISLVRVIGADYTALYRFRADQCDGSQDGSAGGIVYMSHASSKVSGFVTGMDNSSNVYYGHSSATITGLKVERESDIRVYNGTVGSNTYASLP